MKVVNLIKETVRIAHPDCIVAGSHYDRDGYALKRGVPLKVLVEFPSDLSSFTRSYTQEVETANGPVQIPMLGRGEPPEREWLDTRYIVDEGTFQSSDRMDFITPGSVVYNAMGESIGYANLRTK